MLSRYCNYYSEYFYFNMIYLVEFKTRSKIDHPHYSQINNYANGVSSDSHLHAIRICLRPLFRCSYRLLVKNDLTTLRDDVA